MLDRIRGSSDSKFAIFFIIALALAIVFGGAGLYFNISHGQYWKINNRAIDTSYLRSIYRSNSEYYRQVASGVELKNALTQAEQQILSRALLDELYYQVATNIGAVATDKSKLEYAQKISGLSNPTSAALKKYLRNSGLSVNQFEQIAAQNAVVSQQQFGFMKGTFKLPFEDKLQRDVNGKRWNIRVFSPAKIDIAKVSAADMQDYYANHKEDFLASDRASLEYVLLDINDLAKEIKPSEKDIKNYYDENPDEFKILASHKIISEHLSLTSAEEDEDGDNVAVLLTKEEVESYKVKYKDNTDMVKWLADNGSVYRRNQDSRISDHNLDPKLLADGRMIKEITQDNSWIVVTLADPEPEKTEEFKVVHDRAEESVKLHRASEEYTRILDKIKEFTFKHGANLDWAKDLGLKVVKVAMTDIDELTQRDDFSMSSDINGLLLDSSWLSSKSASDPLAVGTYKAVVIRPVTFEKGQIKQFKLVEDEIAKTLTESRELERTIDIVDGAYNKLIVGDYTSTELGNHGFKSREYKRVMINDIRPYVKAWIPGLLGMPVYRGAYTKINTSSGPAILVINSYTNKVKASKNKKDTDKEYLPWDSYEISSLSKSLVRRAKYDKPPRLS